MIVEKLMQGPESGAYPTINPNANLLGVTIKDDICYVNFDSTFLNGEYDILPKLTIYSIVNSLVEGTEATQVQITINGESKAKYMGTVDLSQPLKENLELVAADDKNEKTTIMYICVLFLTVQAIRVLFSAREITLPRLGRS